MEVHEDDDSVVEEIPVYLCKNLESQLHLFQFPCRSANSNHYLKNVVSSRVKPQSGIIELDCALNTESQYYDKFVGEEAAISSNHAKSNIEETNDTKLLSHLTLHSQRSILKTDINCYSVACLYDGKFCISSLHDSLSFLPTYEHKEQTKKPFKNTGSGDSSSSEDEAEESSSAVQVTVKFSQKNSEKTKISHELNHHQHLLKAAEEPWCETVYYNSNSSTALTTLEGLTKTVARNRTAMMSLTEDQYLNVLIPSDTSNNTKQLTN